MAGRVSASITIGGSLPRAMLSELVGTIQSEGLSTEWDDEAFTCEQLIEGEPLMLMAHKGAWGRFNDLEAFCARNHLAFARWSGSCPGCYT